MQTNMARAQRRYELGMRVCAGARPWAPPLTGGLVGLSSYLLIGTVTSSAFWNRAAKSDAAQEMFSVAAVVAMVALVAAGLVYRAVARRCHIRWHTELTAEDRAGVVEAYAERFYGALAARDRRVKSLHVSESDLEPLSPTHRRLVQSLIDAARSTGQDGFCETIRIDAHGLLAAAKLHRELSLESIVREQTAVPLVLVELDQAIAKNAADLQAALEGGECLCASSPSAIGLIDACTRAQEQASSSHGGWN